MAPRKPFNDGLVRANPEEMGVSSTQILKFLDDIELANLELHSFMLMRDAHVVAEGWWKPYGPDRRHMTHSLTKSVLATGIGMALDEGLFSLEDKVVSFFKERDSSKWTENLCAMRVRDLLTMQTGHDHETSGAEWRPLKTSWVDEFLKIPVVYPPGTHWEYTSAASYVLSAILTEVTGLTAEDYLKPRFFEPLGIANYQWDRSPEGYSTGGNGLSWTTADSLKLGALYAQKGVWNGRQLLSPQFVEEASQQQATGPYGYHWWVGEGCAYYAIGRFGQFTIVFPDHNAVLVTLSGIGFGREILPIVWKHFPAAFGAAPVAPSEAAQELETRLAGLRLLPEPVPTNSDQAQLLNGRRYVIAENDQGVSAVSFDFTDNRCAYRMWDGHGEHCIVAGLGRWIEQDTTMTGHRLHHEYQPETMRVVAVARWLDARTLEMTWQFVESAFRDRVVCTFQGNGVSIDRSVNINSAETSLPTLVGEFS